MQKKLDEILLFDEVVENFYQAYSEPEFKNWIDGLLPQVRLCHKKEQDNPWHIYDCLTHILKSVEEMNKQTKTLPNKTRRMLAYCMFMHDLGKPQSHLRRYSKQYKRYVDSFFNHNKKSAEVAKEVLPKLGFSLDETKVMEKLIFEHDFFINIREEKTTNPHHKLLTPKLIEDKVKELDQYGDGVRLFEYLVMIGRSDNLAQNPQMTKESLRLLDTAGSMLLKIKEKHPERE